MPPFTEINVTIIMTCPRVLHVVTTLWPNELHLQATTVTVLPGHSKFGKKGKLPACAQNRIDPYKGCHSPLTQLAGVLGILVLFLQFLARHEIFWNLAQCLKSKPSGSSRKQRKQDSVALKVKNSNNNQKGCTLLNIKIRQWNEPKSFIFIEFTSSSSLQEYLDIRYPLFLQGQGFSSDDSRIHVYTNLCWKY